MGSDAPVALEALVDALSQPVAVIGSDRSLRLCNSAAHALLRQGDGVRIVANRLRLSCPQLDSKLAQVIQSHAGVDPRTGTFLAMVPRRTSLRPLLMAVSPIASTGSGATSLVWMVDIAEQRMIDPAILQALYGLSQAEARVAAHLAAGYDLAGLSHRLRVQPETARSQLKMVFRKMEISRQQDLVRLVNAITFVTQQH